MIKNALLQAEMVSVDRDAKFLDDQVQLSDAPGEGW
jgi:hypothetical protein